MFLIHQSTKKQCDDSYIYFVLTVLIFLQFRRYNCKESFNHTSDTNTVEISGRPLKACDKPPDIQNLAHCRFPRISPTLWEGDKVKPKKKRHSNAQWCIWSSL